MATTSEETGRRIALVDIGIPDNVRDLGPERDEHALKSDRAGECLDVLGVEVADVVGDADVDQCDVAPGLFAGGGHQALPR